MPSIAILFWKGNCRYYQTVQESGIFVPLMNDYYLFLYSSSLVSVGKINLWIIIQKLTIDIVGLY
jgi:hypothetical protein